MAEFLAALMGPARALPFLGDDDGGRLFHPFGRRDQFGRASLAACAEWLGQHSPCNADSDDYAPLASWWLGRTQGVEGEIKPSGSRLFPNAGIAVMTAGRHHVVMDAGPFGPWGAGHSHADSLSLVVRSGAEDILIDPGTFTYVGDSNWRDWFRSTAAHNTVLIRGGQVDPDGPFRWSGRPKVNVLSWHSTSQQDTLEAESSYNGFTHRRRVILWKHHGVVTIWDQLLGPSEPCAVEQWWHLGSAAQRPRLILEAGAEEGAGWRSPVFGRKEATSAVVVRRLSSLPLQMGAALFLDAVDPCAVIEGQQLHYRPSSQEVMITLPL